MSAMAPERRYANLDNTQIRATDEAVPSLVFRGHAAVFDQPTLIGSREWGFVEWIEPGAFREVLEDDVRFLFNHDGLPLARTTNGTLELSEDKTGLLSVANLADITLSRDLAKLIERGDISQMSFAFTIGDGGEERVGYFEKDHAEFPGMMFRAVTKMGGLFDVSPVTYPAYDGTDAGMRSSADHVRAEAEKLRATVEEAHDALVDSGIVRDRAAMSRMLARGVLLNHAYGFNLNTETPEEGTPNG